MGFATITDEAVAEIRSRIGKPIKRVTAPFYREINVDASRNFANAIGDDNPLWVDEEYARRTRWGGVLAPPTILYSTENTVSGAVEGLPSVHAMFAGTDWRWYAPIRVGTVMKTESTLKDMVEHKTRFAGRSFQQIYHVKFYDQHGTLLADADSWCFRTERDTAREGGTKYDKALEQMRVTTEEELERYFEQYRREKPRGAQKRLWQDVKVGDAIDPVLKGPYTVTAAVAFMQAWGSYAIRNHRMAYQYYDPSKRAGDCGYPGPAGENNAAG
ncbi:MAG: MaoC family dehydratase, partial [Burkholderiales bacterium]